MVEHAVFQDLLHLKVVLGAAFVVRLAPAFRCTQLSLLIDARLVEVL